MADRTPTFGDLCCAIAEGQIAATVDDSMYQMSAFELRRFLNKFRSLPSVTPAVDTCAPGQADTSNWSPAVNTSVA